MRQQPGRPNSDAPRWRLVTLGASGTVPGARVSQVFVNQGMHER